MLPIGIMTDISFRGVQREEIKATLTVKVKTSQAALLLRDLARGQRYMVHLENTQAELDFKNTSAAVQPALGAPVA